MKKKIILLTLLFFLFGCSRVSDEKIVYNEYIKELKEIKTSSEDYPFNLEVTLDRITNNEVRYQVILDSVDKDLDDISMIAIHNKKTDDVFPSIGIFDDTEDLRVNTKPSGLILVGYIHYKGELEDINTIFKVLVKYKVNNKEYKIHYVTKK